MKKVLLFDPLEMLSKLDMPPPTTAWEGFEAAVERMARGENVSGERQEASAEEEIGEEEEEEGKQGEEIEAEQGEDTKTTSSRRCGQQTSCECRREVGEHVWCVQVVLKEGDVVLLMLNVLDYLLAICLLSHSSAVKRKKRHLRSSRRGQ